ncbi:hypothetical protein [Clostridium manihotivorum]|uniref:Uncharacterized protein n=1 Tax=Clostridium manihotivorum TaxID=2320868 RepID=A0A3R5UE20_9CLOT|nr:hypothetical protein [Clostridium manihotivorum]QAA31261.1 hypothetical protein C1I91_06150 [Clostridium manihotivorum]
MLKENMRVMVYDGDLVGWIDGKLLKQLPGENRWSILTSQNYILDRFVKEEYSEMVPDGCAYVMKMNIYELAAEVYKSSDEKDTISFDAFIYKFMSIEEVIELFYQSLPKDVRDEGLNYKVGYAVDHEKREIRALYCLNKAEDISYEKFI